MPQIKSKEYGKYGGIENYHMGKEYVKLERNIPKNYKLYTFCIFNSYVITLNNID